MADAKVSVIVPVYKTEKYLEKCVGSIVAQTYTDLEIILVDDGSPDRCPQLCDAWVQRDSRIKVIHKANGGVSSARNCGLDAATGQWIGFVDADDWIEPNMVEVLIRAACQENADLARCKCYESTEASDVPIGDAGGQVVLSGTALKRFAIETNIHASAACCLYRRTLFDVYRFDETMRISEDWLLNYQLSTVISRAVLVNQHLYHYFINTNSVMHVPDKDRFMDIAKTADAFWQGEKDDPEMFDCLCVSYIHALLILLNYLIEFKYEKTQAFESVRQKLVRKKTVLNKAALDKKVRAKLILVVYFPALYILLVQRRIKQLHD